MQISKWCGLLRSTSSCFCGALGAAGTQPSEWTQSAFARVPLASASGFLFAPSAWTRVLFVLFRPVPQTYTSSSVSCRPPPSPQLPSPPLWPFDIFPRRTVCEDVKLVKFSSDENRKGLTGQSVSFIFGETATTNYLILYGSALQCGYPLFLKHFPLLFLKRLSRVSETVVPCF